jgi:hypothetical protein
MGGEESKSVDGTTARFKGLSFSFPGPFSLSVSSLSSQEPLFAAAAFRLDAPTATCWCLRDDSTTVRPRFCTLSSPLAADLQEAPRGVEEAGKRGGTPTAIFLLQNDGNTLSRREQRIAPILLQVEQLPEEEEEEGGEPLGASKGSGHNVNCRRPVQQGSSPVAMRMHTLNC